MGEIANRDVAGIQRAESFQRHLKASSWLYSKAKLLRGAQLVLTVLIPIALTILSMVFSGEQPSNAGLKGWAAFYGILIALFDELFLEKAQVNLKKRAATVQESFDSQLLKIPWNDFKVGDKPSPEDIDQWARSYKHELSESQKNWYPPAVSELPLYLARLVCQRSNLWWDRELRRKFIQLLTGVGVSLFVMAIAVGLAKEMTLPGFILSILAPIFPALMWFIKETKKQEKSSQKLDHLMKHAAGLWQVALAQARDPSQVAASSRELQDEIFVHRYSNQPVPNWFNQLFSSNLDVSMNKGAEELVAEVKASVEGNERKPV